MSEKTIAEQLDALLVSSVEAMERGAKVFGEWLDGKGDE